MTMRMDMDTIIITITTITGMITTMMNAAAGMGITTIRMTTAMSTARAQAPA